jgi:sulfite exporter TauE/SafE
MVGAALGAVGSIAVGTLDLALRLRVLALVLLAAAALDLSGRSVTPSLRQVNAYWIGRYRGWFVGLGFGFQLGLGAATIVTTALVYAAFAAATLSASVIAGTIIMAAFGLARGVALIPAAWITTPSALYDADIRLSKFQPLAARAAVGVACGTSVCLVLVTL